MKRVNEWVRIDMSEAKCVKNIKVELNQAPPVKVIAATGFRKELEEELDIGQGCRGRGRGRGRRGSGRGSVARR